MNIDFITSNPLFGITLSLLTFYIGSKIQSKWNYPLFHPLLIAILLTSGFLVLFDIPVSHYQEGGEMITFFLAPTTALLAYSIYNQKQLLKKYWLAILAGCMSGAIASVGSVYLLCKLFSLDNAIVASLLPKSTTMPIALDISQNLDGISSITVIAVVVTGILGSILCPVLGQLFIFYNKKNKTETSNKIALGVGTGTASHAVGTSRAIELGEIEGAMSGISIGITGICTVILTLFLNLS